MLQVHTNVLGAEQMLSVRAVLGNLGGDPIPAPSASSVLGKVAARAADPLLEGLKPVSRSVVGLHVVTRGAGHVNQSGP